MGNPAVLSRLARLLSAQPRVALACTSRRLARPLSARPRGAGQTIFAANLHDRVYEPYAPTPPAGTTESSAEQAKTRSPLTDSHRRPHPYHFLDFRADLICR